MAKKPKPKRTDEKPKPDPRLGSGWTPGSGGSWMAPDWIRDPIEHDTDGVWRPKRRD